MPLKVNASPTFSRIAKKLHAEDKKILDQAVKKIAADLQIMAKRYADGRHTFACLTVNQHTKALLDMGVTLNPGAERIIWALDGGGDRFQTDLTPEQKTPGTPAAMGSKL